MNSLLVVSVMSSGRHAQTSVRPGSTTVRSPKNPAISSRRTEPGVRSGLLGTVVFGRNEPAPQHLHRGFAAALQAAAEYRSAGRAPAT